jgi:hypothetical protein
MLAAGSDNDKRKELSPGTPFRGLKLKKETPDQRERRHQRERALQTTISADVTYHIQFLEAVPLGKGFCWIYTRKSSGGASKSYGRFKFHGVCGSRRTDLLLLSNSVARYGT